jgi:hypothetical protein
VERRIGVRRTISWLEVTWHVVRRGRWRERVVEEAVSGLDVSTSGIGVRASTVPTLQPGAVVELVVGDQRVSARIRRIAPTDDADTTDYGLEFIDPPPAFLETVLTQAGALSSEDLEMFWRHAS